MVIRVRDPFAALLGLQRAMDSVMGSDWFGSRTSGTGAFPLINVFNDGEDFVAGRGVAGRQEGGPRHPGARRHVAHPGQEDDLRTTTARACIGASVRRASSTAR